MPKEEEEEEGLIFPAEECSLLKNFIFCNFEDSNPGHHNGSTQC